MQELLNQVIVIALAAVPALFVADFTVKLHDRFAAKTDAEAENEVLISDDELMEALASVMPGGFPAEPAPESNEAFIERIQRRRADGGEQPSIEERPQEPQSVEVAADEPVVGEQEQSQIEKFKADRRRILGNRTIRELKSLASESGIPRYSRMSKAELIAALA
jgi:hypothetical protein